MPGLSLLIPTRRAMDTVLNKDTIANIARPIGIHSPVNYKNDASLAENMDFPLILKWANPTQIMPRLKQHGIPFHKCEYCHTPAELEAVMARYAPIGESPLLQSYCPGYGLGQMIYMHRGKPILCFQHQRIHEFPPEGGFSSLCESISLAQHQELFQQSIQLLQAIDWEGPAMVEYRYNPDNRKAVLMEINGRFWGSLPLAYYAGAHFVWTHYAVNVLGTVPEQTPVRAGVRCMYFIPEMKRLITVLFKQHAIQDKTLRYDRWQELWVFIRHYLSCQPFYIFHWRDPKPFFIDVWGIIKRVAGF
jgi:predicted ATP-grasp superfamily ATP-dependent carboligase